MKGRLSALLLIGLIACVLADALTNAQTNAQTGQAVFKLAARALLVTYLAVEWRRMAFNARAMMAVAGAMTATIAPTLADPAGALAGALDTGTFFATFFANQFFLREAARSSRLVHRCSTFFVNQRPVWRYGLLTFGGYLFGIILNLGVLSLLGVMIMKRNTLAAAGAEIVRQVRERRMVLALLRGFSVTPLASPLSISLAVMLTALPSLHWASVLPLGMATAALIMGLGWAQDRLQAPVHLAHLIPPMEPKRDFAALLGVTVLVLLVFFLALGIEHGAAIPLSRAMLVSIPLVGLGWLLTQHAAFGARRAVLLTRRRVVRKAAETFPDYRNEIAILSSAGFIGVLFAALLPPALLGALLTAPWLPPLLLPPLALVVVVVPAMAGVNPIVTVTILASAMQAVPVLPVPVEALAVSLMAGWALSVNGSPLTASAMVLGKLVGKPARIIVQGWNGPFTLVAVGVVAIWLVGLAVVLR